LLTYLLNTTHGTITAFIRLNDNYLTFDGVDGNSDGRKTIHSHGNYVADDLNKCDPVGEERPANTNPACQNYFQPEKNMQLQTV